MLKKILEVFGILMIALGVSTTGAEQIIIPVSFITVGFIVMRLTEKE